MSNESLGTRTFDTGATRNSDANKLDFEGFFSPLTLEAVAAYMNFHRHLEDGSLRASDNWQLGIPQESLVKSGWRHFFDWWRAHRGLPTREGVVFALCGLIFNASAYLHNMLTKDPALLAIALAEAEKRRNAAHMSVSTHIPGGVLIPDGVLIPPSARFLGDKPETSVAYNQGQR